MKNLIIIFVLFVGLYSCEFKKTIHHPDPEVEKFTNKIVDKSEVYYNMLELTTTDKDTLIISIYDRFETNEFTGFKFNGSDSGYIYLSNGYDIRIIKYLDVIESTIN